MHKTGVRLADEVERVLAAPGVVTSDVDLSVAERIAKLSEDQRFVVLCAVAAYEKCVSGRFPHVLVCPGSLQSFLMRAAFLLLAEVGVARFFEPTMLDGTTNAACKYLMITPEHVPPTPTEIEAYADRLALALIPAVSALSDLE